MIHFTVHVHPGSSVAHVGGSHDGALVVRVRARAVEGAATKEVLAALADAFGVRSDAVRCVRGLHSRTKVIALEGTGDLQTQLQELLARGATR